MNVCITMITSVSIVLKERFEPEIPKLLHHHAYFTKFPSKEGIHANDIICFTSGNH